MKRVCSPVRWNSETDLESRLKRYAELVGLAEGQLEILAGGGISVSNRDQFLAIPGLEQVHGTRVSIF